MGLDQWISIVKDILVSLAAIITALVAVFGLTSWRRELQGRSKFEAARDLAKATYEVRDAMRSFRHPFVGASEFPADYDSSEHDQEKDADAWASVLQKRYEPLARAVEKFRVAAIEAEAIWGDSITGVTHKMLELDSELYAAAGAIVQNERGGGETFRVDPEFGKLIRTRISNMRFGREQENPFSRRIEYAVTSVIDELRPYLRPREKARKKKRT